jgi:hypothetical protein
VSRAQGNGGQGNGGKGMEAREWRQGNIADYPFIAEELIPLHSAFRTPASLCNLINESGVYCLKPGPATPTRNRLTPVGLIRSNSPDRLHEESIRNRVKGEGSSEGVKIS